MIYFIINVNIDDEIDVVERMIFVINNENEEMFILCKIWIKESWKNIDFLLARFFSFLRFSAFLFSISNALINIIKKFFTEFFAHFCIIFSSLYYICNFSFIICWLSSNTFLIIDVNRVLYYFIIINLRVQFVYIFPEIIPQIDILVFLEFGIEEIKISFHSFIYWSKINHLFIFAFSDYRWIIFILFHHSKYYH